MELALRSGFIFDIFHKMFVWTDEHPIGDFGGRGLSSVVLKQKSQIHLTTAKLLGTLLKEYKVYFSFCLLLWGSATPKITDWEYVSPNKITKKIKINQFQGLTHLLLVRYWHASKHTNSFRKVPSKFAAVTLFWALCFNTFVWGGPETPKSPIRGS